MAGTAWGGSEVLWSNMAAILLDEGHDVTASIFDFGTNPLRIQELAKKGLKVHKRKRTNFTTTFGKIKGKIVAKFISPGEFDSLNKISPDMVFFSQGAAFDLTIPYYEKYVSGLKVPYFCYLSLNTEYEVLPFNQMVAQRKIFENAKTLFFVSKRNLETAQRQLCSELKNALVINNPLTFSDLSAVPYVVSEAIHFAMVARVDAYVKGHPVVLKILSGENWKVRNWKLDIFGEGPDMEYVKELVRFYKLTDKIRFKGQIQDIKQEIWAHNHVLLMPSQYEGCPISLYDAAVCGRTAVVSDVGGNAEFVVEGENGFIADAPSVHSFGSALERMWQNKHRIIELGENARERALKILDLKPDITVVGCIKKNF